MTLISIPYGKGRRLKTKKQAEAHYRQLVKYLGEERAEQHMVVKRLTDGKIIKDVTKLL